MTIKREYENPLSRQAGKLEAFVRETSGTFALMAGLSALPLALFIGVGVDLAMMQSAKKRIQAAADAATLAAARMPRTASMAERDAETRLIFYANLGDRIENVTLTPSGTPTSFSYKIDYDYKTAFLPLLGLDVMPMTIESKAEAAPASLDVVLVLDNSLSMSGGNRIVELKKAAGAFIGSLASIKGATVQVAVIPFDDTVYVGPGTLSPATSISEDTTFKTPDDGEAGTVADAPHGKIEGAAVANGTWSGCVTDRPLPFDASGSAATIENAATLYPRKTCHSTKLKPVRGLTKDLAGAQAFVATLQPNSLTNITIGLQWGLEAFTPSLPLAGANPDARKIMILMTDGKNTDSRWFSSTSKIDLRMQIVCSAIKSEEIELFTINVKEGDKAQLSNCATDPAHFSHIDHAEELTPVFEAITAQISPVRLSQ